MTDFSALGFNPTPGDVGAVRAFAAQLDRGVTSTADALTLMSDDGDDWTGLAAIAFLGTLDDSFRPQLSDVHDAFKTSRTALSRWAAELAGFQSRAAVLEEEARLASAALARRTAEVTQARAEALADPIAAGTSTDLIDARARVVVAQGVLDDVRRRARSLSDEADVRAIACARLLEQGVALISAYAGSAWDNFTSWMEDVGAAIADGYEWFMDNVMPILEDIIDTIGPIVAVAALFVPALGPLALGLAIASVAIDGLQALRGEEGAAEEFFMGLAGLAVGGALGKIGTALGDGTRQVFVGVVQGGGGLALAGGGTAAGSLTLALRYSPQALMSNTLWMSTKMAEAQMAGTDLATALTQPAVNLFERGRNLIDGKGPRTDKEVADRD